MSKKYRKTPVFVIQNFVSTSSYRLSRIVETMECSTITDYTLKIKKAKILADYRENLKKNIVSFFLERAS